MPVLLKG